MSPDDIALRARLIEFARRHSRAEIARKTGTSAMNVGRYLRSTRVPASFCLALCREFGVNPAWLITGQGPTLVADLPAGPDVSAGSLLKLVQAMSAVTRLKLGSLAGQTGARRVRELDDALSAFERLRGQLNTHSREVLSRVLKSLSEALAVMDMARAGSLRNVAEQLARLCDDEPLRRELLSLQSHHAFLAGRLDEALALLRRRFALAVSDGRIETEDAARLCLRLVVALHDAGQRDDAHRVAEASLALAGHAAGNLPSMAALGIFQGQMLVGQGQTARGLAVQKRWLPRVTGRQHEVALASLLRSRVLAGEIGLQQALAEPGLPQLKHVHLLELAVVTQSLPVLRACNRYFTLPEAREALDRSPAIVYGPFLARVLARKDRKAVAEYRRARQNARGPALVPDIYETQLRLLAGDRAGASRLAARVEAGLDDPGAVMPEARALHYANRLALGPPAAARAARRQLDDLVAGGNALLAGLPVLRGHNAGH